MSSKVFSFTNPENSFETYCLPSPHPLTLNMQDNKCLTWLTKSSDTPRQTTGRQATRPDKDSTTETRHQDPEGDSRGQPGPTANTIQHQPAHTAQGQGQHHRGTHKHTRRPKTHKAAPHRTTGRKRREPTRNKGKKKGGAGGRQGAEAQGTPENTQSRRQRGATGGGGGATGRQGPRHPRPENTQSRRQRGATGGEGGGARRRQGQRHPRPENTQSRTQRGRNKGEEGKKKTQPQPQTGQPQPGGGRTSKERTKTGQRKGEAHQNAHRRPACPTRPSRALTRTHARDPGVASSNPKGAMSASTRNSPVAPAESPVERWTVRETGRVSDRVHTCETTAAQAAQDRSRRDPPGTTPSRGPERVRRGARTAPLPRQGPAAGTKSPVLGQPPRAPRSHPVKPGPIAPGLGEGTAATGKPTGAPRATRLDEERRTNAGPRGTPERHAAGHNHGTRTGAKPQRPPGAANPGSAHNTRRTAARDKVPRTAGPPRPHTAPTASGKRAPAARPKGREVRARRAPNPGRPTPRREALKKVPTRTGPWCAPSACHPC